ncbi:transcriptional regulator BetI [Alphaproteobacteria bacterium GH1-50]|uniref:HTH-type transcriptional regulator BetI n=1 Tax=Kangsaoukella pontilimi TaxID=2691042 RepID=A0A7C9IE20_9RHOB|nr:transcriptional regulator BetI [Kangsaoukella pontilimi]MXQ06404.1 transcriptional regulator BetI [Kangsaoukella pontilimi]
MPKLGMEPIRRAALIDATIAEIGAAGTLDVTVSRIARRAGVSSALAHHYFGGKDDILLAAMRHVLRDYGREVTRRLGRQTAPWARLEAIVEGSFAPSNFRSDVVSAWLNFYVLALSSPEAARLHRVYAGRLRSNLLSALRPLAGDRALALAERAAFLIDGAYLNQGLAPGAPDGEAAARHVLQALGAELSGS